MLLGLSLCFGVFLLTKEKPGRAGRPGLFLRLVAGGRSGVLGVTRVAAGDFLGGFGGEVIGEDEV